MSDYISGAKDANTVTLKVRIDLSKAFYSISHSMLLSKIRHVGTSVSALKWLQTIVHSYGPFTFHSSHHHPRGGTRFNTGSSSPSLIYMSTDIQNVVKHCGIASYVDDTTLYLNTPKDFEDGLSQVTEILWLVPQWCCAHSLLITYDNTNIMLYGVPQSISRTPDIFIEFLGQQLKPALSCENMRIMLDPSLLIL